MPDFGQQMTDLINNYQQRIDQGPKAIMKEVSRRIINRTPIDALRSEPDTVGRARANWIATEGTFNKGVVEKNDEVGGRAPVLSQFGPTVRDAEAVIDKLDLLTNPRYYLTNNIDYILLLEYFAHSNQFTAGMRAATIADFPMIVEQRINEIRNQSS